MLVYGMSVCEGMDRIDVSYFDTTSIFLGEDGCSDVMFSWKVWFREVSGGGWFKETCSVLI